MAPRFPLQDAPDPAAAKLLEEKLTALHQGLVPLVATDGTEMLGWCAAFSFVPERFIQSFMDLTTAAFQPQHIRPRHRELAVQAFISVSQVPYMRYCHSIAAQAVNLTENQSKDALTGKVPQDLTQEEQAAYRLGRGLANLNKPLSNEHWDEFSSILPKSEIVGIANFIGVYQWLALMTRLNGDDGRWTEEKVR